MNTEIRDLSLKEIETFASLWPSFDALVDHISNSIPDILLPIGFSVDSQTFSVVKDYLCISLKDTYYEDREDFYLPLTCLVNGTWKEYIDNMAQEERDKRNKQKEAEKAYKEKKELEEYKRLKEKFENNE